MSDTMWAFLSFLAGWLACVSLADVIGASDQPVPKDRRADSQDHRLRMASSILGLAISTLGMASSSRGLRITRRQRWGTRFLSLLLTASLIFSAPPRDFHLAEKQKRWGMRFLALCLTTLLLFIAGGEFYGLNLSFNSEKAIATERWVFVLAWFTAGSSAAYHRRSLSRWISWSLHNHRNLIAGRTKIPAPSIGAAGLLLLAIFGILYLYPQLPARLTSLSAGGVELRLSEVATSQGIRNAPVDLLGIARTKSLSLYSQFKIFHGNWPGDPDDFRPNIYEIAKPAGQWWRVKAAQAIFDNHFSPIFSKFECLEKAGFSRVSLKTERFILYINKLAALIKNSLDDSPLSVEMQLDEFDILTRDLRSFEQTVISDYLIKSCKLNAGVGDTEKLRDVMKAAKIDLSDTIPIWDPYIITTVADFVAFAEDERAKADFLDAVSQSPSLLSECSPELCKVSTPGLTNFYYQLSQSKFKGKGPWTLDEIIAELTTALSGINGILEKTVTLVSDSSKTKVWATIAEKYRENKLGDLAQGLEIYNERALRGEKLALRHRVQWQAWLAETQQIVWAIKNIYAIDVVQLNEAEKRAWKAGPLRNGVVRDAEAAVSLSLVLLPGQTGSPDSLDCLAARAVINHLLHVDFEDITRELDKPAQHIYKGFLEQIESHVEVECGP